jgi:hypothetical protein
MKTILLALSASLALSANIRSATGATGTADSSTATGAAEALAVTAPTATGGADATFAQSTSSKTPPTTTGPWLDNIKKSITELTTFSENKDKERDEVCQREFAAIKSELDQQAKDEADDKKNQKLNLASALDARIAGFGAALDKLMALMKQLKGHIDNVNVIFQSKYAQDQRDMQVAGEAFESLMTHATEGNPKDVPIKVPILPNFNVSFVEIKTGLAMERLANMEQRLARHLAQSDELPQCEDAHQAAVGLFQKGARYHEEIRQFFSAERKVLAAFREQLASVMRSKLAKLAKLKAQSALLKKSMATPEVDMAKALGEALEAHEVIVKAACAQMDAHTASNGPKRKMLVDKANQCAANTGTGAGVTIGNSTETLLSKVTEVEADVVATTKETGGVVDASGPAGSEDPMPITVDSAVEVAARKPIQVAARKPIQHLDSNVITV